MIIRKIRPHELKRVQEISALAFEYGVDNSKTAEALLADLTATPTSRGDLTWDQHWVAVEDDDKTITGGFRVIPYPIHFDGHHTTMMGIGGVATLPPYRRKGGIRACFEAALPDMYASGAVFSYLYPFSTAYYRKFGYEMCCELHQYQLLLEKLPYKSVSGNFHLIEQGNAFLPQVQEIYRNWQERYNMMVIGAEMEFAWTEKANPFKDQQYSYVYLSGNGTPKAYVTFQKVDEASGRNLKCSRFVFIDREGFQGIINLFISLSADHRYVTFELPTFPSLEPLLPEWSMGAGKCERIPWGMVRVVNVQRALELARIKGAGSLILEINDPQVPENNGIFLVRYGDDGTQVSPTIQPPDASMGIAAFSQLLLGVHDGDMIPYLEHVTIHSDATVLLPLFYKKKLHISEYF